MRRRYRPGHRPVAGDLTHRQYGSGEEWLPQPVRYLAPDVARIYLPHGAQCQFSGDELTIPVDQ